MIKAIIMKRAECLLEITVEIAGADQRLVECFNTQSDLLARYDQLVASDIAKVDMPAYLQIDHVTPEKFLEAFGAHEDRLEREFLS